MQILSDDTQWENCILDAATFQMPYQLREFFAMICVFGPPTNPKLLWDTYRGVFLEDYLRTNSDKIAEQLALRDVEETLNLHRKSCNDFGLPMPREDLDDVLGALALWL
jgi:hypothetical protein